MFNHRAKVHTPLSLCACLHVLVCMRLSACACLHVLWVPITWIGAWWHSCWVRFGICGAAVNTSIPQSNACACFRHEKFILKAVGESKCSYGLKSVPYQEDTQVMAVQWDKISLVLHCCTASSFAPSFKWDLLGKLHYIRTCVKGLRGFVLPQKLIWTDLVRACSGCFGLFQYTSRVSQISQLFNSTILVCSGQLMRREEFIERRCL